MSRNTAPYKLPYQHILGTVEQELLEQSMRPLAPSFRLYNERAVFEQLGQARRVIGASSMLHESLVIRQLLREDKAHEIPSIPEPWWWIAFCRFLWWEKQFCPDPYFEVKWWLWDEVRGKMQCITMWGSQNSGKSAFSGRFPVAQLAVWDNNFIGFIGGPFKLHTQDKTWREVSKASKDINPALLTEMGLKWEHKAHEILATSQEGTGFAKFVAAQEASSIQGGKSNDHIESGRIGCSFMAVDEFIENPNMALDESFGNFRSNFNSFAVLGCNPKQDKVNAPGVLSFSDSIDMPKGKLRKLRDFRWRTKKGILVRFCWQNCPNKILGRTEYTYLMNESRKANQDREDEHIRAAQLDAWGWGAEGANTLTDSARQNAAGVFADYVFEPGPRMRLLALDPAFGGGDPAVYTIVDVAEVQSGFGSRKRFVGTEQGKIDGIDSEFIADSDFASKAIRIAEYRESLGDTDTQYLREIIAGSQVGAMAQIAVLGANLCLDKDIPFDCFTFDASQRADCTDWIFKVFGRKNIVWYYEGSRRLLSEETENGEWYRWPYKVRANAKGEPVLEKWSDWCGRVITMIWAFSCELINAGYLVNGDAVQKSLDELGARETADTESGKKDVWSKADIKRGMFRGKKIPKMSSPAWGETLAMAMYFGVRFKNAVDLGDTPELEQVIGQSGNEVEEWLQMMSRY